MLPDDAGDLPTASPAQAAETSSSPHISSGNVRRATTIGLVCKAWRAAVGPVAFDALQLDPCDAEAVAYFDPTANGPGARLLPLVHACHVQSTATEDVAELRRQRRRRSLSPSAGPYDGNDDAPSEECDAKSAVLADLDRPMPEDGTLWVERAISQAFRRHDPKLVWPRLASLNLTWSHPISELVPVAAQLYLLPELRRIRLFIPVKIGGIISGEEGAAAADDRPGAAGLVRPLDRLEEFFFSSIEISAEILAPLARLLSPVAPLESVTWLGITPAALFEQLGRGEKYLPKLALGCTKPSPEACARSAWPHLRLLGTRIIERLSFDLRSDPEEPESVDAQLTVGELLNNLPPNIRHAETEHHADCDGHFTYPFQADETFSRIRTGPRAPMMTFLDNGLFSRSFRGRECVQTVTIGMYREDDEPDLCFFALRRRGESDGMAARLARGCG